MITGVGSRLLPRWGRRPYARLHRAAACCAVAFSRKSQPRLARSKASNMTPHRVPPRGSRLTHGKAGAFLCLRIPHEDVEAPVPPPSPPNEDRRVVPAATSRALEPKWVLAMALPTSTDPRKHI